VTEKLRTKGGGGFSQTKRRRKERRHGEGSVPRERHHRQGGEADLLATPQFLILQREKITDLAGFF